MKVKEKLAKTESTSLVLHGQKDGKIRVGSMLWPDAKIIHPDEVLEVRVVQGTLRIARKVRERDEQDLPKTMEVALADGTNVDPMAVELDPVTGYATSSRTHLKLQTLGGRNIDSLSDVLIED